MNIEERIEVRDWLRDLEMSDANIDTLFNPDMSGAERVVGLAAKRCYLSFEPGINKNVTSIRKNWHLYFENILRSGHGSVLEHAYMTFAIEGLSRIATAELNRHRVGSAISEGSMRYIRQDPLCMTLTPLIKSNNKLRKFIERAVCAMEEIYHEAETQFFSEELSFHEKKILTSALRRMLPMGIATGGVWTFNLRALRHIISLRSSESAEEEIAYIAGLLAKRFIQECPRITQDFTQCERGFWKPKYGKV